MQTKSPKKPSPCKSNASFGAARAGLALISEAGTPHWASPPPTVGPVHPAAKSAHRAASSESVEKDAGDPIRNLRR